MEFHHVSVLRNETIDHLIGDPHGIYVDCTLGGGGHSRVLAERLADDATLIGLDQDQDAIAAATAHMKGTACHFTPVQQNFRNLGQVLDELHIDAVDGVMFDLGVSSYQLDTPERGFSYMQDGPLDMRMDQSAGKSAYDVINTYSEAELYRVIKDYGEERWASRIAEFIVRERQQKPISHTAELVSVIKKAIPAGARKDGPHPAKRTFQAIRIEVNDELGAADESIQQAMDLLALDGRISVITFHSLEDRLTKQLFKEASTVEVPKGLPFIPDDLKPKMELVNRKPILPSDEELEDNNRSHSAKLRVARKIHK